MAKYEKLACVHCGAMNEYDTRNPKPQAHCWNEECNKGWALWEIENLTVRDGECMMWTGLMRRDNPYLHIRTSQTKYQQVRVKQLVMEQAGLMVENGQPVFLECGRIGCINPDHQRIGTTSASIGGLRARLDAKPLLEWADARIAMGIYPTSKRWQSTLRDARKTGYITVGRADEICIDWLGIHPFFIFGEEFYDA